MKSGHEYRNWQVYLFITFTAALLFIPFLGGVHLFDWDEINFAESAREMVTSGDYLTVRINFVPFWEKPPLFIWLQALSMNIFGMNEFAARFPNAICGIVTLIVLFSVAKKHFDERFASIWVMLYAGSILPFFYFKSGIIDPWFNLFIFLGIYHLIQYFSADNRRKNAAFSGLFIGLAILTKGPVAFLILVLTLTVFIVIRRFKISVRLSDILVFAIVLAATGGFWFILQIVNGNFSIIADFIVYQIRLFKTKDAGHGGFLLYHFVILLAGVFPASIFALPALVHIRKSNLQKNIFFEWMTILFWVVLILFTIVKTKIVHYSSLCYFPLTFLAAWTIYHSIETNRRWKKVIYMLVILFGSFISLSSVLLTFTDHLKGWLIQKNLVKDSFAIGCLNASGGWKGFEFIAGLVLVAGLIWFSYHWFRHDTDKSVFRLTSMVAVFMFMAMFLIVPKVEAYSQRAAIEFFKSVSNEDAYLETVGYKSYAHLFYGSVRNHPDPRSRNEEWILTGNIDKPVYISVKISKKNKFMKQYPDIQYLYESNGFAFFKRTAVLP